MRNETSRNTLAVITRFVGEEARKFLALKKKLGLRHDSEVCRYCVNIAYAKEGP